MVPEKASSPDTPFLAGPRTPVDFGGFAFAIARSASDGALIELGSAIRPLASLNPNLIGRPVALRPLPGALFAPVTTGELVLHAAVWVPDPGVEVAAVGAVGLHGVAFRQLGQWDGVAFRQ